ncbi:hypothetical protein E2C01_021871 [Portunus trituberculatus]|uniref:Uncharacterized protein n=1 Tax=Portunus trituberculatus TaxID=210409 RepID=A0A5B7E3R5_PORTR|nr:hypothetical protein [Portunus trituberculatus]
MRGPNALDWQVYFYFSDVTDSPSHSTPHYLIIFCEAPVIEVETVRLKLPRTSHSSISHCRSDHHSTSPRHQHLQAEGFPCLPARSQCSTWPGFPTILHSNNLSTTYDEGGTGFLNKNCSCFTGVISRRL